MVTRFILYALLASSIAGADYLDDRVARVFPFEAGQEYEFLSAEAFHRPNGDVLPANTEANITVTDTAINDTTWLHIPYWSPWGSEYYRLDDSMRVISYDPDDGSAWALLTVDIDRYGAYGSVTSFSALDPFWPEEPARWAYFHAMADQLDSTVVQSFQFYVDWESVHLVGSSDSMLVQALYYGMADVVGYREWYGRVGDGSSEHLAGYVTSVFRPASSDPWPQLAGDFFVDILQSTPLPAAISVQAVPNPFNPQTVLRFDIPEAGTVRLAVYDVNGRAVRTIVERHIGAGSHEVTWDGRDDAGRAVASGVYLVRVVSLMDGRTAVAKVTLVR